MAFPCILSLFVFLPLLHAQQEYPPLSAFLSSEWTSHERWDENRAEVAVYASERVLGGVARPYELRIQTSAETFNREEMIPAAWPYGDQPLLPVIRQTQSATIPAPGAAEHLMSSVVLQRDEPARALLVTTSSHATQGITTREFRLFEQPPVRRAVTPHEAQATPESTLPEHDADTRFEEELPLLVRMLPALDGFQARLYLRRNQTGGRLIDARPAPALLTVSTPDQGVTVPAGSFAANSVWRIDVEIDDGRAAVFIVERAEPNRLLLFEFDDGRRHELVRHERMSLGSIVAPEDRR